MDAQGTEPGGRRLALDRLTPGPPLEVLLVHDATFGDDGGGARSPHRHDYHELIWTRQGEGHHLIDGDRSPIEPLTLTVIGRGQVHVLERGRGLHGAILRFGDEIVAGDSLGSAGPTWLLGRRGASSVRVPAGDAPRLEATIDALRTEASRPLDPCGAELQRHLLSVILLWVERWYDAGQAERPRSDQADVQLYRRFAELLERDFSRSREVSHYADELRVPPARLAAALVEVTGRATKELITDRVMLEGARLLRFTDLTVGEIAFRIGFDDQLYFSRAFKRNYGRSPSEYREAARTGLPDG